MKLKYIFIALLPLVIFSCKPEMEDGFKPSSGDADFSTYVALGNSLTAGYADGARYKRVPDLQRDFKNQSRVVMWIGTKKVF